MKTCTGCKEIFQRDNFYRNARSKDGLTHYCKGCMKKTVKSWVKRNPDKRKKNQAAYAEKHKEELNRKRRLRCQQSPASKQRMAAHARKHRLKQYGLDDKAFLLKLKGQKAMCSLCGCKISEKTAVIDHCHSSGVTRDLLCRGCNGALGHIEKEGFLQTAMEYIERHRNRIQTVL